MTTTRVPEIVALRKHLGHTQEKFAQVLGVSVATVRKWEQGKNAPSRMAFERLDKLVKKLKREAKL